MCVSLREDPDHITEGTGCPGDNDPLDAIEIGELQCYTLGYLGFGPIEKSKMVFVTSVCVRRTGAAS